MGKRGREIPKRKDGNPHPKDINNQRQRQPDVVPSTKQAKKKSEHCSRNTGSSSKDYSDPKLRCPPLVVITQEYKLIAEEALRRISSGRSKHTGTESSKESSSSKQSSTKLGGCEKEKPSKRTATVRLSKRTPNLPRKSPRRNPSPKLISSCTTSSNTHTSEEEPKKTAKNPATTASRNKSPRKALVRALTRIRKPSKSRQRKGGPKPNPAQNSQSPPVKRALRKRKACPVPVSTVRKSVLVVPRPNSRKMDKLKEPTKEKEEESKSSNSSNESSNDAQDEDSATNNTANNESDSDDVEMQVLEKQVLSDKEEENDELPETSLHLPFVSDEESGLLSPSALPASSLFRSPSRRKKRSASSGTKLEQTSSIPPPPQQTHQVSLPVVNTTKSYYSSYKQSLPSKAHHMTNYSSFSSTSSFSSKLASSSFSQYPGKRGRGRPRKALEDVKSVGGKLYRKKLAEMVGTIGVGRGRPIYSPNQTTTAFPSTSYEHDKTPYDDNFDDDPMAATFTPPASDQDIGRRMQRWQNRSTFIYAKHKFRNNLDSGNGNTKDKFMCKVCKVGFTALSSLKRHYGTIYHKQQEQAGRGAVDFLATSNITESSSRNRNDFRLTRDILPSSSSSSPSLNGGRRGPGQRPSSQPKITSFSRNKADNIKKYYAAADAARRRREGVDGVGGGSWIQKQQRRRKPLAHTDYIYHPSDLPAMGMEDDDSYLLDEMEMGEVRDEDIENNYPAEYDDLIRSEEQQAQRKQSWLSNVWKGVGPPHFTCEFCNESFTAKKEFTRHLFKHRQEEALTCPECQLRLPNESALENHTRQSCNAGVIDGVRSRFRCNMCISTFSKPEYLKHHLEIHMRPPVRCLHCPKKFSHKFFLQDHIKAMHEWTNHNGNGNGLATTGMPGMGSAAPTEITLTSVIFPINSSPKPKIELFCPAAPLVCTDNRRKSTSGISGSLPQNFPQILPSSSSVKKGTFTKPLPSPASKTVSSTSKCSSLSDYHVPDLEDVAEEGMLTKVEPNTEPSSSPRSRPRECVNLFKKYFHDEGGEGERLEVENKEIDDHEGNVDPLADVEQSTTEDGNLVWQFKPSFDSGLGESQGNIPSLTIEIPRDKIDFDEEEKGESKVGLKTFSADHIQKSYSVEQHHAKNQQSLLEKVSLPSTMVSSFSNLPLLGCGCKSSVLEKPLESPLVCQDCGKSFEHRKSLVKHVRYYSQSEDYSCNLCGKTFKLKHHVSRHLKSFHNVDNSSTSGAEDHSDLDALSSPSGSNSGGIMTPTEKDSFSGITFEGKFASGITSISSPSKRTYSSVSKLQPQPLPKKIRKRLESSPAIPGHGLITYAAAAAATVSRKKSFTDTPISGGAAVASSSSEGLLSSATAIVASDGISAFKCLICKKLYPSKHQLNSHMWYHKKKSTIMPYKCMDCSMEFKLKHDLTIHQQQMHSSIATSIIKHNCTKCPAKNFPNRKDLLKHMREKHSYLGRKPPSTEDDEEELKSTDKIQVSRCPFCPLVFPRESDLKEHMGKEHMRCIACNDCGLVLGSKDQLEEHMEKEHGHRRQESEKDEEEEDEDDDDDEDSPPTPSPHTSPIHISSFGRDDDEDVEEEEDEDTQEDPESEFELLELN